MSGFGLVPVDGGDLVKLSPGETVLGRGPLLGISDTRVSRHHGLLENLNGKLRLKPCLTLFRSTQHACSAVGAFAQRNSYFTSSQQTHVNPCFILSSVNVDPRPLEKGSWHQLHPGDLLSLLPGRFIYRVEAVGGKESTPRNSQNLEEEEEGELPVPDDVEAPAGGPEQEQMSDPDGNEPSRDFIQDDSTRWLGIQNDEPRPASRRRVLPAWMMAVVTAPKTPAAAPKVQSGVKRSKLAAASSATQATATTSSLPSGVELHDEEKRPTKKSRKLSREEENLPTQMEVPSEESTSRLQVKPSGSGFSSYFDHLSTELEDEGKGEGSSQKAETRKSPTEEKSQSRVRTPCPYGKDCYRKNPLHFNECSHPGDSDYEEEEEEEEDRPECPYGTDCYRKEFKHTKKPARSARSMAKNTPDEGVSDDEDDSFINDDSDDLGNDSDYVPPGPDDSEQEDVQRLQKEATAYLKKGRR
ncbi:aprataxin and PNK-like factor isoform X2 [Girardinichthys multiradiatus]|uniref:aprataxin and PNK-like factor isoform X2 n=1 Tax=Girardinichthys multiradiatus TaxID=208333 RepID=UPI001FACF6C3|nr:aprataxin and PNK-like factor isoform X2 [Girardinichthys multiradiatus]